MGRAAIELRQVAADVAKIPDAGLFAAAKLVKRVADDAARATVSGGDMSGKHRRPIKLRARDKSIRPIDHGRAILITGVPAGPWVWVTSGTAPHTIRRRKRGPMRKMTVHHPGTRGRDAWTIVIDRSTELVPLIFRDLVDRAI